MSLPPIPKLPPEPERRDAPTLPDVPVPSGLQSLAGLFLLAQAMPQMLPQATQQIAGARREKTERDVAQFQLEQAVAAQRTAQIQQQFENALKRSQAELQQIQVADEKAQAAADRVFKDRSLKLQEDAAALAAEKEKGEEKRFKATAANMLGEFFRDAMNRVEETYLNPAQRAALLSEVGNSAQYQALLKRDGQEAANRWLNSMAGTPLSQTEKMRRAAEIVQKTPGARALMDAAGLKPEDVFYEGLIAPPVPTEGPVAEAWATITDIAVARIAAPGAVGPEELKRYAQAAMVLGIEGINEFGDSWALAMEEIHGTDRDTALDELANLIRNHATWEQMSYSAPEPPGPWWGERAAGAVVKHVRGDKEKRIKELWKKAKAPLFSKSKREEFRQEALRLERELEAERAEAPPPRGSPTWR